MRSSWITWQWPIILIISAIAAGVVTFVLPSIVVRPIVVTWFLFICPGMVLVRFLRLKEPLVEWVLALALSFSVDAIIGDIQVYTGRWSPTGTLVILMSLCIGGAIMQITIRRFTSN